LLSRDVRRGGRCKEDHDGGRDRAGRGRGFHDPAPATTEHSPDAAGTLCRNPLAGEVSDDRVKLAVRASVERLPQARVELVGKQSALAGGAPQLLGDVRSIGVRCTHVSVLFHLLAPSRIAACGSGTRVRAHGRLTKGWALSSGRMSDFAESSVHARLSRHACAQT
jgi:hypothetical protein